MNRIASQSLGLLAFALVLMAVAPPRPVSAQGFSGGLRADLAAASFVNEEGDTDPRIGVRVGAYGDLDLGALFDIRAEAVYAMKGVKSGGSGSNTTIKMDYLEVPILAKLALGSGSGLFVMAGPAVGIKLSAKVSGDSGSFDYGDLVKPLDVGLVGGIGFDTAAGGTALTFDVRYSRGLTSFFDFGDPSDTDSDDKHQVLSVGVGVGLF